MRFRGKSAFGREKHAPGRRFQREVGGVRIDPNDAGNPERIAAARPLWLSMPLHSWLEPRSG